MNLWSYFLSLFPGSLSLLPRSSLKSKKKKKKINHFLVPFFNDKICISHWLDIQMNSVLCLNVFKNKNCFHPLRIFICLKKSASEIRILFLVMITYLYFITQISAIIIAIIHWLSIPSSFRHIICVH